jgi:hypothetical protein
MVTLTATTEKPKTPPNADFALVIDFKKGEASPTRVFTAATDFIHAFEAMDQALTSSIDTSIETVMVLEDVEAGSLKVWLRNALNSTDDQALKDIDWKPAVGKYLVRAKYMILEWIDDDKTPRSLPDLRKDIAKLAQETDVRHLPDYSPPDPAALIDATRQIQTGKERLSAEDKVYLLTDGKRVDMDLSVKIDLEELADLATKETITTPASEMILAVKRPDYLGNSKWDLRHGRRPLSARISDDSFLSKFQGRKVDVRTGDALRCRVSVEMRYGFDNELISESFVVTEVLEVLEDRAEQPDMFDND